MTATLFAVPAFAADAPAEGVKPSPVPDQKSLPAREEIIKRFDQDGDGQLSDTERQAMREAWKKFLSQQPSLKPSAG